MGFIEENNKERQRFVHRWAEYVRTHSDKEWSRQQNVVINSVLEPAPKQLDEARGLITADYQTYLDNEWVKELRNKYNIIVNRKVLKKIK